MDLDKLQTKLFQAARLSRPDETVPYAFENRIIARLPDVAALNSSTVWNRILWKGAAVCAAFSIILGIWSVHEAMEKKPVSLEVTVFSMAQQLGDTW